MFDRWVNRCGVNAEDSCILLWRIIINFGTDVTKGAVAFALLFLAVLQVNTGSYLVGFVTGPVLVLYLLQIAVVGRILYLITDYFADRYFNLAVDEFISCIMAIIIMAILACSFILTVLLQVITFSFVPLETWPFMGEGPAGMYIIGLIMEMGVVLTLIILVAGEIKQKVFKSPTMKDTSNSVELMDSWYNKFCIKINYDNKSGEV